MFLEMGLCPSEDRYPVYYLERIETAKAFVTPFVVGAAYVKYSLKGHKNSVHSFFHALT